jgi:hypothetical protein
MKNNIFEYTIPSQKNDILKSLIGSKLTNIIKCSHYPITDYLEHLNDTDEKVDNLEQSFFQYDIGPLLLSFDNKYEISLSSLDEIFSIIMKCEKAPSNSINPNYLYTESDIIERVDLKNFEDSYYLKTFLNKEVQNIEILRKHNLPIKAKNLPSETGIKINFEQDRYLLIVCFMTEKNRDFSLLTNTADLNTSYEVIEIIR